VTSNYAKSDTKEPRPSVSLVGVKSTNFNYFKGASEDTTLGQDDSIRGPGAGIRTPTVYAAAQHNSAKATGINRVVFTLLSPSAAVLATNTDVTVDANGYYSWDMGTTGYTDNQGYLIKAEAFDSLGKSEVATMRVNIDNTDPAKPLNLDTARLGANLIRVTWTWTPDASDSVPIISRFIIYRKPNPGGSYSQRAAVPGTYNEFFDPEASSAYASYTYQIRAIDTAGNTMYGDERDRIRSTDPTDLVPPFGVTTQTASSASWKAIDLYWPPASDNPGGSGMAGYLWYSSDNYINWTIVGQAPQVAGDPLYYQDVGLKPGKKYFYYPKSFDLEGNVATQTPSPAWATTPLR